MRRGGPRRWSLLAAAAAGSVLLAGAAPGAVSFDETRLPSSARGLGGALGAASGSPVVARALGDIVQLDRTGNGWRTSVHRLVGPNQNPRPTHPVATSGNWIVAGNPNAGAAWVINAQTGAQTRLTGPPGSRFGDAVAVHGDTLAVGAPGIFGVVYLYRYLGPPNRWSPAGPFTDPFFGGGAGFGSSLAFTDRPGTPQGWHLLVGAPFADRAGQDAGAVVIVEGSGASISSSTLVLPAGPSTGDNFGAAVSAGGGLAAIGAPFDDDGGANRGSITVLELGGGLAGTLLGDPGTVGQLGWSVDVSGDRVAAGATPPGGGGSAAYVFDRMPGGWERTLLPGHTPTDRFGTAVAVANGTVFVGAPNDSLGGGGAVYAYEEAPNGPPTAENLQLTTHAGTPVEFVPPVSDPDGDPLQCLVSVPPRNGSATIAPDCSTGEYTPDPGFAGRDSFRYRANDGQALAAGTIVVRVTNTRPEASDDNYQTASDTPLVVAAPGVLANDTDPDGDALTTTLQAGPRFGSVTVEPDGSFAYTPPPGFSGRDGFRYLAEDGFGGRSRATVIVDVIAGNAAPTAVDDAAATDEDTPVEIDVLANDTDPDGDPLTITNLTQPANGTAAITGGAVTYTPDPGHSGPDSFTYTANDGSLDSNVATVDVTVDPVNEAPVALDDAAATDEDTPVEIDVLANDTDPDGDPLTITNLTQPANGTAAITGGAVTYTPDPGHSGPDSFTYTANDGSLDSNVATVDVTVVPAVLSCAELAADTTWVGGDGNWNDAAKWTNGVPTATESACIESGTVTVNGTFTVGSIVRMTGTLVVPSSRRLTIDQASTLHGTVTLGGRLFTNETVTIAGTATMSGNDAVLNGDWLLTGSLSTQTAGSPTLATGGGTFTVAATGVLAIGVQTTVNDATLVNDGLIDIVFDSATFALNSSGVGPAIVNNATGTIRKSAGTGTIAIRSGFRLDSNGGTFEALSGTLLVDADNGGTWNGAVLNAAAGAVLELRGNQTWRGTFTGSGQGLVDVTTTPGVGGSVTGDGAQLALDPGLLRLNGGDLQGTWTLVTTLETAGSGTVLATAGGTFTVAATGVLAIGVQTTVNDATLVNDGLIDIVFDSATFALNSSGVGPAIVNNATGTIRKSAGTDTIAIRSGFRLDSNGGAIESLSGTLLVDPDTGTWNGAVLNAAAGAGLELRVNLTWRGAFTGSGAGDVDITGNPTGDNAQLALDPGLLRLNGGDLQGTWTLVTTLETAGSGTVLATAGGTFTVAATGTLTIGVTTIVANASSLVNDGLVDIVVDGLVLDSSGAGNTIANSAGATIQKSAGAGTSTIDAAFGCTNDGTIVALVGTLTHSCT